MRSLICIFLVTAVCASSGCSGRPRVDGVVPVTGTVTYQGKPAPGATVSFSPAGDGRSASATTNQDGAFALTTLEAGDGALPGNYKVSISKSEVVNPMSPAEQQKYFHEHQGRMPPLEYKHLLPEKYRNPNTSGFTAEVKAPGTNKFDFELAE